MHIYRISIKGKENTRRSRTGRKSGNQGKKDDGSSDAQGSRREQVTLLSGRFWALPGNSHDARKNIFDLGSTGR